jgi:glycosyltransferase involved in cell wall biosynthesis
MKIIIAHQTVVDNDAIGQDTQGMFQVLQRNGYEVYMYAEYINLDSKVYKIVSFDKLMPLILDKNNLLLYHHSFFWQQGEKILSIAECKVMVRYHNITPSRFFEKYSPYYFKNTLKGEQQTDRLIKKGGHYFWLGDSHFNCNDLRNKGIKDTSIAVLPPFHKVDQMEHVVPDHALLKSLLAGTQVNVLFIGRVVPNKGHKHICEVASAYKRMFGKNVRFWIVGGLDNEFKRYNDEMDLWVKKYGLQEIVRFVGQVPLASLKSYLLGSHVFLCLSEHEGFCVPLIEAQYFKLPVIACESTVIKETLGPNQMVFDEFNEELIASAINAVVSNENMAHSLAEQGSRNYKSRFAVQMIENKFMAIIKSDKDRMMNGRR